MYFNFNISFLYIDSLGEPRPYYYRGFRITLKDTELGSTPLDE
jgi:hypothetical protein